MTLETSLRFASAIAWITTALFFSPALFTAIVIPIQAQEALTFGGRTEQSFPVHCSDLSRYRVFVLTTDQGSSYAVFRVGT